MVMSLGSLLVVFKPFKLKTSQLSSELQKFENSTFQLCFWFCVAALMDKLLEWDWSCIKTRTRGLVAADVYREHETVLNKEPSHVLDLTTEVSAVSKSSCLRRFWRVPDLFLMCLMHEVKSVFFCCSWGCLSFKNISKMKFQNKGH